MATVKIESEHAVDTHQWLEHEASHSHLLEVLLEKDNHVRVVGANDHLLGGLLKILDDLLEYQHLARHQLLLEVALKLSFAELLALFE